MKTVFAIVSAILLGASASTYAAEVTGQLVDLACYQKEKASPTADKKGMEASCQQSCAKNGQTVALVTDKGEVYEVMAMGALSGEKNAKLVPHMTHTVTLTGDVVTEKDKKMIHATALKMVSK